MYLDGSMVESWEKPDLAVFIEKNVEHKQVAKEAPGFDFSPNNPIIVICISVTDRNM
jgi:hypothetical protein